MMNNFSCQHNFNLLHISNFRSIGL